MAGGTRFLLGAYALGEARDVGAWYRALSDLEIDGLEHPVRPDDDVAGAARSLARDAPTHWDLVLTTIPTVMSRLGEGPEYGLASDAPAARRRAVEDVRRALELARHLADLAGRPRVLAVEVHSAPGPVRGSRGALMGSLEQLLADLPPGVTLLLEHCDRLVAGQPPQKGFLSLEEEIVAVAGAGEGPQVRLGLNWGRSAIEGRNSRTPDSHARRVSAAGLAGAAVVSGATERTTAWGEAWTDAHIPPRGADPALRASIGSLLDQDAVERFLTAVGPVPVVATKVAARPADAPPDELLAVARASLAVTRRAFDAVTAARPAQGGSTGTPRGARS